MKFIIRIFLIPFGFIYKLFFIGLEGSRDLQNIIRFRKSIIDKGCCIDSFSIINSNCHILENVFIANSSVSSYSYIGKSSILQNATIGSFCSIANEVYIGLGKHPIEHFSTSTLFYRKQNTLNINLIETDLEFEEYQQIEIGCDVWIGARAIILDGIKIGHGAIIAANSVVTKDVQPYAIVGGIPAKIIRYRFNAEKIQKLLNSKWWNNGLYEIEQEINYFNSL